MTSDPLTKFCTTCGLEKPLTRFGHKRGQYRHECNDCRAYQVRANRNGLPLLGKAPEPESQTCIVCGQIKPIADFAPTRGGRHLRRCHTCEYPLPPALHERVCVRCGEMKPAAAFHKAKGRWPRSWCKECSAQAKSDWAITNAERIKQYKREHPHYGAVAGAVRRARLAEATIERIDRALVIARDNDTCYICGAKPLGFNLTLDHVIPLSKGGTHSADNLRVACRACNARKYNLAKGRPQGS
jgi:hypothetical protein